MQKFNYHTHTVRCHHAIGTEEEMIQGAIQGGFEYIGLSEHMPFKGWPSYSSRIEMEEVEDYLQTAYALKEKYKDQIQVCVGFETEYFSDRHDEIKAMREKVDYLILGEHSYFRGEDECWEKDYYTVEQFNRLADEMIAGINTGFFSILAHPDYFLMSRCEIEEGHKKAIEKVAIAAKEKDVVVEINLKGTRRGKNIYEGLETWMYPNHRVFEIFAKVGCKVCFGYDAHSPSMLVERDIENTVKEAFSDLDLNYVESLILE